MEACTKDWVKRNLIELAKDHKKHCHDERCTVQLCSLLMMCNELGIELTHEEKLNFI